MKIASTWLHRWIYYLVSVLMFTSVVLRSLLVFQSSLQFEQILSILTGWILALLGTILLANKSRQVSGLFIACEVLLTQYLFMITRADFFGFLFIIPCMQVMQQFTRKWALMLIVLTSLLTFLTLLQSYGLFFALGSAVVYFGGGLFLVTYIESTRRARAIQEQQHRILRDLNQANDQLLIYSRRLQQLAAGRERQRLARELHDSVTQTLFSMTLTTQAAILLLDTDRMRGVVLLDRLCQLTHNALAEMQVLISRLSPEKTGNRLIAALHEHAAERSRLNDLSVQVQARGSQSLSVLEEENLYRIVQEALNNIVKYAGVSQAKVRLYFTDKPYLEIEDNGIGFDPRQPPARGHMGLANMEERAREIGWTLRVDSSPGNGTRIQVRKDMRG